MNDNQAIINKIISDAEEFASSAAAAAEAQAQAAIAEARAKAEESENAERENAAKEGEEFVARRMQSSKLFPKCLKKRSKNSAPRPRTNILPW